MLTVRLPAILHLPSSALGRIQDESLLNCGGFHYARLNCHGAFAMAIVAPMTFVGIARIARQTFAALFFCGPVAAWALLSTNMRRKMGAPWARCYHLHPRRLLHPVTVRAGSADMFVFAQILADHEFAPLDKQDFRSVIDLGGNIGLASAWFLSTFGH